MTAHRSYSELPSSWFEPSVHSTYVQISAKLIGASPPPVAMQPRLLSILDFLPLFEAFHAAERPEAGIGLGLAVPAAAHGSVGFSALSSDTVWDAMTTIARYTPTRNAVFTYRCFQRGDAAILELRPRLHVGELEKFFGYTTVLIFYKILKAISEDAVSEATRLAFPWRRPAWQRTSPISAEAFDFDENFLGIRVPLNVAMRPSQSADPDLCKRVKMAGEEELTKSLGSTAAKVRHLLRQKAPVWPSLQEVADEIAMSKRTVIRKLEAEELGYQLLLDEARSELACWLLRRSDVRLSEIADQIGFSDQAGFTRSFRRVQGCTPSQYRADYRLASDTA